MDPGLPRSRSRSAWGCWSLPSRTIPMGTAYAVWGGIGAVGTVIVGMAFFNEPATHGPHAAHPRHCRLHRRAQAYGLATRLRAAARFPGLLDRRQEFRGREWPARLLIGITQRQDQRVRPFRPDEAEADRKPLHLAHRHGEVGITRHGGEVAGATARNWSPWTASIGQAAAPSARPGRSSLCCFNSRSMPLAPAARCWSPPLPIFRIVETLGLLRLFEQSPARTAPSPARACALLKAITSASVRVFTRGGAAGEIGVEACLELGQQHLNSLLADRACRRIS